MAKIYFILTVFLTLFLSINFTAQSAHAAGADKIFFEIGQDKPAQWDTWPREQKHSYYQSLGIYPDSQGHYSGKTGSLDIYFEMLGKEMPDNWSSMTFAEKKIFAQGSANKEVVNQSQAEIININKNYENDEHEGNDEREHEQEHENEDDDKKAPLFILILLGTGIGSFMIFISYKTDKSC